MNKYKTATIINDCHDDNAAGRQLTRVSSAFGCPVNFIGVKHYNELGAAGNIIDTLDAVGNDNALILVNIAPRHGDAKRWPNGSPFGWFKHKNTYVISTIDGHTLSLVKKFGLTENIHVFDFEKTSDRLLELGVINKLQHNHLSHTQFRSFDFTPRIAGIDSEKNIDICDELSINEIPDAPKAVWWVDNFGNCKTTLLEEDLDKNNKIKFYARLKDVPNSEPAFIIGSSGLQEKRFVELVIQGESAAEKFNLKPGDDLP
jgi:hypothetical protein